MHARELVELAAIVAVHAPLLAEGGVRASLEVLEQYWSASRCRIDRWSRLLVQLGQAGSAPPPLPSPLAWPRLAPVLEEIVLSEMLTRIWAAAATAHDAAQHGEDLEPIARSVLAGHLDVRRRLLAELADPRALTVAQVAHLDHLRRRVERWTDMLLAHAAGSVEIAEFAFEIERARDFAQDLNRQAANAERAITCQLIVAAIKGAFASRLADRSPNSDLNRRVASSILAAIREHLDESTGLVKSAWLERMARTAADTEGLIEELLRM